MTPSPAIDIHQHLWPPELIDALRRAAAPTPAGRLDAAAGRRAAVRGRPDDDHDAGAPARARRGPDRAGPVQPAGHRGPAAGRGRAAAGRLARRGGRAAARTSTPGRRSAGRTPTWTTWRKRLADGFVGLQIPATWLATPSGGRPAGGRPRGGRGSGPPGLRASRAGRAGHRSGRRPAGLVGGGGRLPEPAARRLVVLARRRPVPVPRPADLLRRRRRPGAGAPRAISWPAAAGRWSSTRTPSSTPRRTPGRASTA